MRIWYLLFVSCCTTGHVNIKVFQVNQINLGQVSCFLASCPEECDSKTVVCPTVPDDADGHVVGAGDDVARLGGEGDTVNERFG